jgi:bacilliredoxin
MPYPEMMVAPMREDLTRVGFTELKTPDEVDAAFANASGSTVLVVNSICGCAAGSMRPAVAMSLENDKSPEVKLTVFAGQEIEATNRARDYIVGYPPSSPSVALFKDGELVYMMERHHIEGQHPMHIAEVLKNAYDEHL